MYLIQPRTNLRSAFFIIHNSIASRLILIPQLLELLCG
jgi:hypothetical protein